jgi:phosphate starvation-inducible PhoH-like protein
VDLQTALHALDQGQSESYGELHQLVLATSSRGKALRPRTLGQKRFVQAMERHDLTLAIGPAGTGKTFLATVQAVRLLQERRIERIVLTRPAVEAGERLGFLPGDLQQKVDPYLRPLSDALHTLLGRERTETLQEKGVIEVAPLAYMRGRTLADAFVILDEAQNTSCAQMRMVLTRLGENSRMVVTGDVTQIDLPPGQLSGLVEAEQVLAGVEGVAICRFGEADVVRHPLVQRLVRAYASRDERPVAAPVKRRFDGPQVRPGT